MSVVRGRAAPQLTARVRFRLRPSSSSPALPIEAAAAGTGQPDGIHGKAPLSWSPPRTFPSWKSPRPGDVLTVALSSRPDGGVWRLRGGLFDHGRQPSLASVRCRGLG